MNVEEELRRLRELLESHGRGDSAAEYLYYLAWLRGYAEELGLSGLYYALKKAVESMIREGASMEYVLEKMREWIKRLDENAPYVLTIDKSIRVGVDIFEKLERLRATGGQLEVRHAVLQVGEGFSKLRLRVVNPTPYRVVVRSLNLGELAKVATPVGHVEVEPHGEASVEREVVLLERPPDSVAVEVIYFDGVAEKKVSSTIDVKRLVAVSYREFLGRGLEPLKRLKPIESFQRVTVREKIGEWVVVGRLGEGSFGEVFVVRRGDEVAVVKRAKWGDRAAASAITREWEILKDIHSKLPPEVRRHVVKPIEYGKVVREGVEVPYIVVKFYNRGSLARVSGLSPRDGLILTLQIGGTLLELYRRDIIKKHGDIKPENVLIDEEGRPVLTDFGTALVMHRRYTVRELVGTPGYICSAEDSRADVYALARVLTDVIVGVEGSESQLPPPVDELVKKSRAKRGGDCDVDRVPKMEEFIKMAEETLALGLAGYTRLRL